MIAIRPCRAIHTYIHTHTHTHTGKHFSIHRHVSKLVSAFIVLYTDHQTIMSQGDADRHRQNKCVFSARRNCPREQSGCREFCWETVPQLLYYSSKSPIAQTCSRRAYVVVHTLYHTRIVPSAGAAIQGGPKSKPLSLIIIKLY